MVSNNKYRGILKDVGYWHNLTLNKDLIQLMLDRDIIYLNLDLNKKSEEEKQAYIEEFLDNSENLSFPLIWDFCEYYLNPIIIDDIYNITKYRIKKRALPKIAEEKLEIEKNLHGFLDKESKISFLNDNYKSLISEIKDYKYFKIFKNEKQWEIVTKGWIKSNAWETIKYYLTETQSQLLFGKSFKYYEINIWFYWGSTVFELWEHLYITNSLETYYKSQIAQLKKIENNVSYKSKTPLFQVLFIDCLRNYVKRGEFSYDKIDEYLLVLINYNRFELARKRDLLLHLIKIEKHVYDNLSANKLGEYLHDITGSDLDMLRKNWAVITKKEENYTKKQKEMFSNKASEREGIYNILNSIG